MTIDQCIRALSLSVSCYLELSTKHRILVLRGGRVVVIDGILELLWCGIVVSHHCSFMNGDTRHWHYDRCQILTQWYSVEC